MFGYVKVESSELKVKEYECYRAIYCGLCRSMGKCTGQCSRMTLSYDIAFLAVCRMALLGGTPHFEKKRCIAHPLHKRSVAERNETLDYCSGAAAILTYHRLCDDLADERGAKRLRARLTKPFAKKWRKRAAKAGLSALDAEVAAGLAKLSALEGEKKSSVDEPAAVFGDILASIMSFGLPEEQARIAMAAGRAIGRWIYIADALDDAAEDAEKGRYNPFLLLYGHVPTDEEREGIEIALKNELFGAESAIDLIDFSCEELKSIVYNILYLGMPRRIERINRAEKENREKEKGRKKK